MIPEFTVEEKVFIKSVREGSDQEQPLERIPCMRTISFLMARANTPELSEMMDRAQNKLGMMTDREYAGYDFNVEEMDDDTAVEADEGS